MPSVSAKQHRLMEAVAHGWHKPGGGPSAAVGKEFVAADKAEGKYANGGPVMANKGYLGKTEHYAAGGPVAGKVSDFMKTPDQFRGEGNDKSGEYQDFAKSGPNAGKGCTPAPAAKDKSLKAIKPKK